MFSPGLPVMFLISGINFLVMYWIDKFLILRFYKLPKNFDADSIKFTIEKMKYAFIFHLIVGLFILSSSNLLPLSDELPSSIRFVDKLQKKVSAVRIKSVHMILFILGMVILILINLFEKTVFSFCKNKIKYLKRFRYGGLEKQEALSNDLFEEIHVGYLVNDYERTKVEKKIYL
jgi:hypothetical protein